MQCAPNLSKLELEFLGIVKGEGASQIGLGSAAEVTCGVGLLQRRSR